MKPPSPAPLPETSNSFLQLLAFEDDNFYDAVFYLSATFFVVVPPRRGICSQPGSQGPSSFRPLERDANDAHISGKINLLLKALKNMINISKQYKTLYFTKKLL